MKTRMHAVQTHVLAAALQEAEGSFSMLERCGMTSQQLQVTSLEREQARQKKLYQDSTAMLSAVRDEKQHGLEAIVSMHNTSLLAFKGEMQACTCVICLDVNHMLHDRSRRQRSRLQWIEALPTARVHWKLRSQKQPRER